MIQKFAGTPSTNKKSRGKTFTTCMNRLSYRWDSGEAIGRYLEELKQGRQIAWRRDGCQRVRFRRACFASAAFADRRLGLRKRYRQDLTFLCYVSWDASLEAT
jgi:hypothetical protein